MALALIYSLVKIPSSLNVNPLLADYSQTAFHAFLYHTQGQVLKYMIRFVSLAGVETLPPNEAVNSQI